MKRAVRWCVTGWMIGPTLVLGLLAVMTMTAVGVTIAVASSQGSAVCAASTGPVSAGGGWLRVGATIDPTYGGGAFGQYYNGGLSYAELGATPGYPNYVGGLIVRALGVQGGPEGLPGGFPLLIRPVGSNSPGIRILKSDVGSGQAGDLHYVIDLHPRIAQLIHFTGKEDVEIKAAGNDPGVATATPVGCTPVSGAGRNPIPGWVQERDDMGVDARSVPGAPIFAPAASTLVQVLPDWYAGQPLLLFKFDQEQAGTMDGTQYWYSGEEISPVSETIGTDFQAGQVVARFAPTGTGIEIGWGSPSSDQRTLAGVTDPAAANPAAGSLTTWAESFKQWTGMPKSWLGVSP